MGSTGIHVCHYSVAVEGGSPEARLNYLHLNGSRWSSEIEEALQDAEMLIVVLSPDAKNSKNVEAEWSFFRDQGKPIYPIKIASCSTPLFLYPYQILDLTENQENGLARLLDTLRDTLFGTEAIEETESPDER